MGDYAKQSEKKNNMLYKSHLYYEGEGKQHIGEERKLVENESIYKSICKWGT